MLCNNIKEYIQNYNIYVIFKVVKYNSYDNLQSLFILTHLQKNLLIDLIIGL